MKSGDAEGFTILEILIAGLILAGSAAVIFGSFVSAARFAQLEIPRLSAAHLAREKLEELYEAVRQDFWEEEGRALSVGTTTPERITLGDMTFVRSVTVSAVPGKNLRRADVTVRAVE